MEITFIRHFKTKGNLEKRYVGTTDEDIIEQEVRIGYPNADMVFSSPLKRCIQTAKVIYSDMSLCIEKELRETDFGEFEYKNYGELKDNKDYLLWLESNGIISFPNGERREDFIKRSVSGFYKCVEKAKECEKLAFIVHGGNIMAILSQLTDNKNFYDFQCGNGCGFITKYENGSLRVTGEFNE
ncbi:MAG: histidine phosphatase family protein [Lachnospiraceae bacterium]|nr:histidine phosphatase family protein [Lachnospiraceae bacterium]